MTRPTGRPPKTLEQRVLEGNPGKRPLPAPPPAEKPGTTPPVPAALKTAGREAWRLYWTYGKAWLAYTDIPVVARLCRLMDRAAEMDSQLDSEGLLHQSETTGRSSAHYLMNQVLAIYKSIADLESAAGFTPSDRSRLKAEPVDQGDEVERWMKTG